eukprot:213724_1
MFQWNKAYDGNMEGGYGGAIYAYDHVTMIITQTLFENNFAQFRGAALYQGFGGQFQCNQCQFISNKVAAYGGAIFNEDQTSPNIDSNNIMGNYADVYGGGYMMLNEVFGQILGSTIEQNQTGYTGGGEALMWSIMQETGGAIFCGQSDSSVDEFTAEVFTPNIHNVVFLGNSAASRMGWFMFYKF